MKILFTIFLSLIFTHTAHASLEGTWACQGTVFSIDDQEGKPCRVPALAVSMPPASFAWRGEVHCEDGARVPFEESATIVGHQVRDTKGTTIGTFTPTDFAEAYTRSGLDYATSLQLGADGSLKFQHDQTSRGIPVLRWAFRCER